MIQADTGQQNGNARLRILRRPEVEALTGLGCTAIYRLMDKGEFPKPVRLTAKAVGWRSDLIDNWIETRSPEVAA